MRGRWPENPRWFVQGCTIQSPTATQRKVFDYSSCSFASQQMKLVHQSGPLRCVMVQCRRTARFTCTDHWLWILKDCHSTAQELCGVTVKSGVAKTFSCNPGLGPPGQLNLDENSTPAQMPQPAYSDKPLDSRLQASVEYIPIYIYMVSADVTNACSGLSARCSC